MTYHSLLIFELTYPPIQQYVVNHYALVVQWSSHFLPLGVFLCVQRLPTSESATKERVYVFIFYALPRVYRRQKEIANSETLLSRIVSFPGKACETIVFRKDSPTKQVSLSSNSRSVSSQVPILRDCNLFQQIGTKKLLVFDFALTTYVHIGSMFSTDTGRTLE